jgi:hypothetical protein
MRKKTERMFTSLFKARRHTHRSVSAQLHRQGRKYYGGRKYNKMVLQRGEQT